MGGFVTELISYHFKGNNIMTKDIDHIVDILLQVDGANQTIIKAMEGIEECDKEKVREAKDLMESAYALLLQSLV